MTASAQTQPIESERIELPSDGGSPPRLHLIDGRAIGVVSPTALRQYARELCASADAPFCCRSYSFPLALVAWHTAPVGCDIERIASCEESFADSIRTPEEREHAETVALDGPARDRAITSLWSSKEALAKALGDALSYDPRRLRSPHSWLDGSAGPWRVRELEFTGEHLAWVCWHA